jgi:DNA anti-recombination protein RmuC
MTEETNNPKQSHSPKSAIDIIADTMLEFREEMEFFNNAGTRIAARTRLIIRVGFTALLISSVILVYMIYQMANNMSAMTTHMVDMYNNFGSMSQDMKAITNTVDLMGNNVAGVPLIAESMTLIDRDVSTMNDSVYGINQNIAAIDNDMIGINTNMQEMTGRLSNMKHSVNSMSYDVNDMSQPMTSGPWSDFWPR